MGSAKVTVENSNLLDFNVEQNSKVTVNSDGTLTINGTGGFSLNIDKLQLKAGITYYQKVELISGSISGSNINNTFLSFAGSGAWISSINFSQTILNEDTEKTSIWVNASAIFNNAVIKIWANTDESDFILHQSQTAIMPIQQEMLDGDYTADVEHHEWGKAILSGNEDVIIDGTYSGITQFKIAILNVKKQSNPSEICVLSNYFLGVEWNNSWTKNNSIVNRSDNSVRVMTSKYTTIDGFKALLKSKYDEGNPVVIYYKLEKTINLELTEEQKTVRDTKLYTYKNITNINVSDELASVEVEYKKDQDTINKNYENRLAALEAASVVISICLFVGINYILSKKDYKLEDMLYKIAKMYIEGRITEAEKSELDNLARSNARAENSYDMQKQLDNLEARVKALEEKSTTEEPSEPAEKYPEYVQPTRST